MEHDKLNCLELSLTMGCSINCDYCPQDLLLKNYYREDKNRERQLSFKSFKTALKNLQLNSTLVFSGMSEPFHNRECADMIVYAYEKGYEIWLNTTLMGMTDSDFEKIKNITFKNIFLHIPDRDNHSKFVITDAYLQLLKQFNDKNKNSIHHYSCHGELHEAVKPIIVNRDKCEILIPDNRAGSLEIEHQNDASITGEITCYNILDEPGGMPNIRSPYVMLPDGSLVLCCQDYGMKHVLGNLVHQSWNEICEGAEYQKVRAGFNDDTIDLLCRRCNVAKKRETLPAMCLKKSINNWKISESKELPKKTAELLKAFSTADHICVFGLGRLWKEHFYEEYWHEGLGVTLFSDNNPELQDTYINGIKCVKPSELKEYKNLLVVVFVKNGSDIVAQIRKCGIENVVLIDKVYEESIWLSKHNK